jgi:hypothetical protein
MNEATFMAAKYVETPLPLYPRLADWVHLVDLGDERLQFRAPQFVFTLQSDLLINTFQFIKPMLDGNHCTDDIASSGGEEFLPTTILFVLKMFRAHGLLQEARVDEEYSSSSEDVLKFKKQIRFFSQFIPDAEKILLSLQKEK